MWLSRIFFNSAFWTGLHRDVWQPSLHMTIWGMHIQAKASKDFYNYRGTMKYSASLVNIDGKLDVVMTKGDKSNSIDIASGKNGFGSSISGGEVLFLAVATCYCNDIYREARKFDITVDNVEVVVDGDFGGPGEPASNVSCKIKVAAQASDDDIRKLVEHTDKIAEIPMSIRKGTPITVTEIIPVGNK